jgi:hypothetical protein
MAGVLSGDAAHSPTRKIKVEPLMGRRPTLSRALSRQASATGTHYRSAGQIDLCLLAAEPYSMQPAASTVEQPNRQGDNAKTCSNFHKSFRLRAGNRTF